MHTTAVQTDLSMDIIHRMRVVDELKKAGISKLGLSRFDVRYLPFAIRQTEHIMGIAYGYNKGESIMLVATDHRVIYLNKKPLYVNQDDISYDVVSGVSFSHAGLGSTITLHTRIKDYTIHTFNRKAAGQFVHFIQFYCMKLEEDGSHGSH